MPLPKDIKFVTFDVYGTLIDWEDGAYKAFQKEADRDGYTINKDEMVPLFHEIQRETESGRKPERDGSSGQPIRLAISSAVRRRTSA
jgi:FMN phosphatase YigB (HAD superfamily)